MENHPIPQDITGFQFKLIGNMTIKQFAYLATGVVLGWIIMAMPISPLSRIPIASVFALFGICFAFVPIEGRPIDAMIAYFIKALINPTQFIYQKIGADLYFPERKATSVMKSITQTPVQDTISKDKLKTFLETMPTTPKNALDEKELAFLQTVSPAPILQAKQTPNGPFGFPDITSFFRGGQSTQKKQSVQKLDDKQQQKNIAPIQENNDLQQQEEILKAQLASAKKQEASKVSGTKDQEQAHQRVVNLENLLNETLKQKQQLESQLLDLQKKLEQQNRKVFAPSLAVSEPAIQQTKHVRSIPKNMGKSVGLPVASEFPNVITGIIKDPRNNPLTGILVEIKDEEGNPIRAFKTNPLGQFASATPLANGTYTIDFEDPSKQNRFDTIEFTASGEIILPLEIISIDEREELRKSLFG